MADPKDPPVIGYFQTIGVTARDEKELRGLVEEYLRADLDSELIGIDERWVPDLTGSDRDIQDQIGDLTKMGIWYTSGRAFYGPEE